MFKLFVKLLVNITQCMSITAIGYHSKTDRRKCKHLDSGGFGGYICKCGHQIETTPRISKDSETCRDKDIA